MARAAGWSVMEFLKKHYEKIALAVVSLVMIGTALTLLNKLGFAGLEHPRIDRADAKPLGTNDLAQIEMVLKEPLLGMPLPRLNLDGRTC